MSYGTVKSVGITITTVSGKSFHVQLDPFDPMSGGSGELLFLDTGLNSYFKVKSVADLCEKLPSCCMGLQYSRRAANAMKKYCEKIMKSIQQLDDIDTLEFQRIVYSWGYEAVENADDLIKKLGYEWNKDESEENAAKRLNELFLPGKKDQSFISAAVQRDGIEEINTITYEEVKCLHLQTKSIVAGYRVKECFLNVH